MLGIVVILALVASLVWAVYLHHERAGQHDDETTVVDGRGVASEKFAETGS
jgi:threonine/homoserine efflux transporter RhtA